MNFTMCKHFFKKPYESKVFHFIAIVAIFFIHDYQKVINAHYKLLRFVYIMHSRD